MKSFAILPLIAAAAAAQELCGQYEAHASDGYIVNNNMWGQHQGTGSQCTYIDSISGAGVAWHTTWTWSGGETSVKSYPYSGRQIDPVLVSSVSSIPSTTEWSYDNTNINANVAYDLFTAADRNHETSGGDYELMIWLARYGNISPIGSQVSTAELAGITWEVWSGLNGDMQVYSFVVSSPLTSFNADIKEFWNYLTDNYSYPADSQYLLTVQVGTEPFTGDQSTFTVSSFTASVQ
ncbi:concanavalin A-like lectin/glucanase domain-containing protein [Aspergillus egyptiacus]|nr:concanavalin A-like lectin/glucanase domain-containing protein [Aspergillus egyptiacus]